MDDAEARRLAVDGGLKVARQLGVPLDAETLAIIERGALLLVDALGGRMYRDILAAAKAKADAITTEEQATASAKERSGT